MARLLRIQYPGAWYHVTCRGNERASIYQDDKDRKKFLAALEESVDAFRVELHCYALMSNHFHVLVKTPEANLSRFMHRFTISQ
jgi:putative transposase